METIESIKARAQDNFEQARAHERYRTDFSKITISILGILVGLLSVDDKIIDHSIIMYGTILFGIFGALVNAKHYERNRFHNEYAHHLVGITGEKAKSINLKTEYPIIITHNLVL